MWKIVKRQIEVITPERAEQLTRYNTFDGQRPLLKKHILELYAKMQKGEFRTGEIGMAVKDDCEPILVNGQHTIHAIILCGVAVPCLVEVARYETADDLAILFTQYDTYPIRGQLDIVRARAVGLGLQWPVKVAQLVASGAVLIENKKGANRLEKANLLTKYLKEGDFINSIFSRPDGRHGWTYSYSAVRHLARSPVVATMMETWRKHKGDAIGFWEDIRDADMLKRNSPQLHLFRFLSRAVMTGGDNAAPQRNRVSNFGFRYCCIMAWNAYQDNRELKILRIPKVRMSLPKIK